MRRGDWQAARDLIAAAGTDWELRGRRIRSLADLAATDGTWLDSWLSADPDDAAAVLLQSARLSTQAGNARGGASAARTTGEQFANFHRLSEEASATGRRAIELADPGDPVPWVELLGTMYAGPLARAGSIDEVFEEGRRRDPYNFELHLHAVSLRCQKWHGSHELMFATAREAAAAPPGSNALLLPLFAHFEYAMREFAWDDRTGQALRSSRHYFQRLEVREEVDSAVARWRAGTPNLARASTCRHWLALYYTLAGRKPEAKAVFTEIGQYVDPAVAWGYFYPSPAAGFIKSWRWATGL